jgi:toxin CptA
MPSAPAIAFDYRPSRRLQFAAAAALLLATLSLALTALPLWLMLALMLALVVYALFALWRLRRRTGFNVAWHEAGHWQITREGAPARSAELHDATVRGEWIVLRLRLDDRRMLPLVLAPDNSDAELRRRLRVRLGRGV